jgi:uncharacterized coiled-coil protein SlyX
MSANLEKNSEKINELEKNLAIAQENIYLLGSQIKDTQKVLTKMAQVQNEMSKRMVQWPFIAVDADHK